MVLKLDKGDLKLLAILVLAGLLVIGSYYGSSYYHQFKSLGFVGIALISFISSSSILLPAPGLLICLALIEASDSLVIASLAAAFGAAVGELTGYGIGYSTGGLTQHFDRVKHLINTEKAHALFSKYGYIITFLLATIPNPFFDLAGITAGYLRMDVKKFFLITFAGNILKYLLLAKLVSKLFGHYF